MTSSPGRAIRDVFMEEAAFSLGLKVDIRFGHLWRHFGYEHGKHVLLALACTPALCGVVHRAGGHGGGGGGHHGLLVPLEDAPHGGRGTAAGEGGRVSPPEARVQTALPTGCGRFFQKLKTVEKGHM